MILTKMIDIHKNFQLTKGQGHKVKGQGQINTYVKNLKNRHKIKEKIDDNDTYTNW